MADEHRAVGVLGVGDELFDIIRREHGGSGSLLAGRRGGAVRGLGVLRATEVIRVDCVT
jgi:hypothetical protein